MIDFLMPSLGADMESGTVVEWLVRPGSKVSSGDVVAVVETHKGAIEVEIFEDGVVTELCVAEGEEVAVGMPLARLTGPDEASPSRDAVSVSPAIGAPAPPLRPSPRLTKPAQTPPAPPPASAAADTPAGRAKASPAARRRAAEIGLDIDRLSGTGIDGSVTLADVEAAAKLDAADSGAVAIAKPRSGFDAGQMRRAIAAAMSRSKREIPHYYLSSTIDLAASTRWLETFNRQQPPDQRLLAAVLLLKATALALRETPKLNGFWLNDEARSSNGIHIGWAISLRGGGLIAPAIHDVDAKSLPALMAALRDLVARARSGGLRSSELTDPSFTVTSLGERGADEVIGVIYPPQLAILGFGRIAERPWATEGRLSVRPLVTATLSGDHRATDGHAGGQFLAAIDRLLQQPEKL